MEKQNVEPLHVERPVESAVDIDIEKRNNLPETAYVGDNAEDVKRKKTPAERKLVWKSDLTIVPLAALIYLVAYLVRPPPPFIAPCTFMVFPTSIRSPLIVEV